MDVPHGYVARPNRGPSDHPATADVLGRHHDQADGTEMPTVEQFDVVYAHLHDCEPDLDIALVAANETHMQRCATGAASGVRVSGPARRAALR